MKKIFVLVFLAAFAAVACAPGNRRLVKNAGEAAGNEVIVVGRVIYDPPLNEESQQLNIAGTDGWFRYRTYFVCDTKLRKLEDVKYLASVHAFEGRIETYNGETFYSACKASPFYMIAGVFYKNTYYTGNVMHYEMAVQPASFYVDIKSGDKAIYIGTIKYYRDNFFNITKIEIQDEYNREMPAFRKLFGPVKLRKALIRQPEKGVVPKVGSPY